MERRGVAYWALRLLGAGALANGLAMLLAPEPWFARVAAVSLRAAQRLGPAHP
jgi:hypothetical protein